MRLRLAASRALAGAVMLIGPLSATPAFAICKKLGFTVNHYGKEGPTRDAKKLLDGYIASWTKERGIKKYRLKGKKTVSCYKFLDFGFFDEWTCKAVQEFCFRGNKIPDVIVKGKPGSNKTVRKKAVKKSARKTVKKKSVKSKKTNG